MQKRIGKTKAFKFLDFKLCEYNTMIGSQKTRLFFKQAFNVTTKQNVF